MFHGFLHASILFQLPSGMEQGMLKFNTWKITMSQLIIINGMRKWGGGAVGGGGGGRDNARIAELKNNLQCLFGFFFSNENRCNLRCQQMPTTKYSYQKRIPAPFNQQPA